MNMRGITKKYLLAAGISLSLFQPVAMGAAVSILASTAGGATKAEAVNAETVARIAQAITVRIEGATQGSGVLVKREGNRYIVLTAWHVISGQRLGEEIDIYTPDGRRHPAEIGSARRLGQADLATLSFSSSLKYELARLADSSDIVAGTRVFVSGFPVERGGLLSLESGELIANATANINQGYQLLYTNKTAPGMSGGAILGSTGFLIGTHGRGEINERYSEDRGQVIKRGINQGVPITHFIQPLSSIVSELRTNGPFTRDDYLVQIDVLSRMQDRKKDVIKLADLALKTGCDRLIYLYRASAKSETGDAKGALSDITQAIAINPNDASSYNSRGYVLNQLSRYKAAIKDFNKAIEISPQYEVPYNNRGWSKKQLGDLRGAIADYGLAIALVPNDRVFYNNRATARMDIRDHAGAISDYDRAITMDPRNATLYTNRGTAKFFIGDLNGAMEDINQAISIDPRYALGYLSRGNLYEKNGNMVSACDDWRKAAALGRADAASWVRRQC